MVSKKWAEFIKDCEANNISVEYLKSFAERKKGTAKKSDLEILRAAWPDWVVKNIKNYTGFETKPTGNVPMESRIQRLISHKGYKFAWTLFHGQYYNDEIQTESGETVTEKTAGPKEISDEDFNKIKHSNNIRAILQKNKIK
jgi:hypothetical protein